MSYWTWVEIDTGGEWPGRIEDSKNMTRNVSPIWAAGLGFAFRDLDKMNCAEAAPHLERAIAYLRHPDNAAELHALEPSNGWGTLDHATEYLETILGWCRQHPKANIAMSY